MTPGASTPVVEPQPGDLAQAELVLVRRLHREGHQVQCQPFDGEPEDVDRLDQLFRRGWRVVSTFAAGSTALRLVLARRDRKRD